MLTRAQKIVGYGYMVLFSPIWLPALLISRVGYFTHKLFSAVFFCQMNARDYLVESMQERKNG